MKFKLPADIVRRATKKFAGFSSDVDVTMAIVGGKYKAAIVWWLNEKKVLRYSEIQRHVPAASARMLSQQLKELVADGVVERRLYPVVPPKTEYSLTPLGKSLVPVVNALCDWGYDFLHLLGLPSICEEAESKKGAAHGK
ncbi:MAG: winged helix-turn-helix transcriptional regulator [Kiritimatiellia bacterium]